MMFITLKLAKVFNVVLLVCSIVYISMAIYSRNVLETCKAIVGAIVARVYLDSFVMSFVQTDLLNKIYNGKGLRSQKLSEIISVK